MRRVISLISVVSVLLVVCVSCGGNNANVEVTDPQVTDSAGDQQTSMPMQLPLDALQPWEILDADGKVSASLDETCEFAAGVERYAEGGNCSPVGDVLSLTSGEEGGDEVSYSIYRLPLGSAQLGTIGLDLNLKQSGESRSEYYVGLSDYGRDVWEWQGPYNDGRLILPVPSGEYTSEMGNTFVCLVAFNGAAFDIVGVSVAARDETDTTPPLSPAAPVLTAVEGGLLVDWIAVAAGDLAGYRIYHSNIEISDTPDSDVPCVGYLEGTTQYMLTGVSGTQHVRIAAVDVSGNESELSSEATAVPQVGSVEPVVVTVDVASGLVGFAATITATGAETYDFDLDGDGVYDVTDNTTGAAAVDTDHIGIIRPAVMGRKGMSRSRGAVSLIVSGNSRPVAAALANPQNGTAPLAVTFTGTAEDMEDEVSELAFAWDFDGDGTFEEDTDTLTPSPYTYNTPGFYNAKLRVEDSQGSWDVDTVGVLVSPAPEPANTAPVADLSADTASGDAPLNVQFDASGSSDYDGTIVEYAWDWDGDGLYDTFGSSPVASHTFTAAGSPQVRVRVEDNDGAFGMDTVTIAVNVAGNSAPVAALTSDVDEGLTPLAVAFDATGSTDSDGSIVRYDWDFDGDGNYEVHDGGDSPDWTYTTYGSYTAMVRVTDDDGAQDTETLEVCATTWDTQTVDSEGDVGWYSSLARVNGNPAIAYYDTDNGDLKYIRASDQDGAAWNVPVTVASAGDVGKYCSLCVVEDYPAISYYDFDQKDLMYVRATDSCGSDWGTPVTLDSANSVGHYTSMCIVNGRPAISYYGWTSGDLKYIRATNSTGGAWNSPVTVDSADDVGMGTSMCIVNGYPAISYYDFTNDALKYVRATNQTGGAWDTPVTVDAVGYVGLYPSMCVVDGNPAISYWDGDYHSLKYIRAADASGTSWNTPLNVKLEGVGIAGSCLRVGDSVPAISFYSESGHLMFAQASDATGSAWDTPLVIDDASGVGQYSSMIYYGGKAYISYFAYGSYNLKFAVGSFPD